MQDINCGYLCNNNCIMCTAIRPKFADLSNSSLKYVNPTYEEIILEIDSSDSVELTFTGAGEPTIRKDLAEIFSYVKTKNPNAKIRLLSNGRMFAYSEFVSKMKNSGLTHVEIPIHSSFTELHDFITQSKGSFEQTCKGIKNLQEKNIEVTLRIIVHKINYFYLKELINFLKEEFFQTKIVIIYHDSIGSAIFFRERLMVSYEKVMPKLKEALEGLPENYPVFLLHFPHCILPESLRHFSCGVSVPLKRICFADFCDKCKLKDSCSGIWKTYKVYFGFNEFSPISLFNKEDSYD